MTKYTWTIASLIVASIAYAEDSAIDEKKNPEKAPEIEQSENLKKDQSEPLSLFDRVIEIIAEAACNNPDYGKDIGDR